MQQILTLCVILISGFAFTYGKTTTTAPTAPVNCTTFTTQEDCCKNAECGFGMCGTETAATCHPLTDFTDAMGVCNATVNNCTVVTPSTPVPTTPGNSTGETTAAPEVGTTANASASTVTPLPSTPSINGSSASPTTEVPDTTANPGTTEAGLSTPLPTSNGTSGPAEKCDQGQRFDTASFIGGIVLAIGVIGIVFLGCKFFRAKSEQTYHQF